VLPEFAWQHPASPRKCEGVVFSLSPPKKQLREENSGGMHHVYDDGCCPNLMFFLFSPFLLREQRAAVLGVRPRQPRAHDCREKLTSGTPAGKARPGGEEVH
jgi:hypothetical protein